MYKRQIDYGFAEAATTYGRIGIKVWIYKGEVLSQTLRTTPRTPVSYTHLTSVNPQKASARANPQKASARNR